MTVFVVSVEQNYAGFFYVDKAFSTRELADEYASADRDRVVTELVVDAAGE